MTEGRASLHIQFRGEKPHRLYFTQTAKYTKGSWGIAELARCLHTSLRTQDHFPEPTQKETEMHASNPSAVETDRRSPELTASQTRLLGGSMSMRDPVSTTKVDSTGEEYPRFPCVLYVYAFMCAHETQHTHVSTGTPIYKYKKIHTHVYRNSYTQVQKDKEWSMPHSLSNLRFWQNHQHCLEQGFAKKAQSWDLLLKRRF